MKMRGNDVKKGKWQSNIVRIHVETSENELLYGKINIYTFIFPYNNYSIILFYNNIIYILFSGICINEIVNDLKVYIKHFSVEISNIFK